MVMEKISNTLVSPAFIKSKYEGSAGSDCPV